MVDYCSQDEFLKFLNDDDEYVNDNVNNNNCLISHEPLDDSKINLPCGHSFNYFPLYKEIYNQKKIKNVTEIVYLKVNQIKCPYCRAIHNYLIPYREMEGVSLVYSVNSPRKYVYYESKCEYVYSKGKNAGSICGIRCMGKYCNSHKKYLNDKTIGKTNIKSKVEEIHKCKHILLRGPNKGNECGNKVCKISDTETIGSPVKLSDYCIKHHSQYDK